MPADHVPKGFVEPARTVNATTEAESECEPKEDEAVNVVQHLALFRVWSGGSGTD